MNHTRVQELEEALQMRKEAKAKKLNGLQSFQKRTMHTNKTAMLFYTRDLNNERKRLQSSIKARRIELKKIDLKLIKLRDADR